MEINFEDYLNDDERKAIIADVFRKQCSDKFKTDSERIFSNAAYKAVTAECDKIYDFKWVEQIASHAKRVIMTLSASTVFAKANAWDKENSRGYDLLQKAVQDSEDLIKSRVIELIGELSQDDIRMRINDAIYNIIEEKLFKREATNV